MAACVSLRHTLVGVVDEAFKSMYFKTVLADLREMVATKTSMGWQLDCNSTLVESETRRPSSPE